ncbi:hypothetical protein L1S34_08920 [Flavobacterium sp. K77]|uniref:hypothetical protein n=1 Tax=Flavobacterium sp. K77 TaxID=2910676 RepID=UPI001F3F961D|nr:hypothetical protein [Flavobacterium sp. K77]MCF6141406.1 hypothetical protein [Flavobacterium sp. K77]
MRKFGVFIGIFLFLGLSLAVALDYGFTTIYKQAVPRTKFQYLRSLSNTKVNYIFLGSSRVENGIDPKVIEQLTQKSVANAGYEAAKLGDLYTMLQLVQEYRIKADTVFIQIDYIFDIEGNSINLPYEMAPFTRETTAAKEYYLDYLNKPLAFYYFPFYRYLDLDQKIGFRELFANAIAKKTQVLTNQGFSPLQPLAGNGIHDNHEALPDEIRSGNIYLEKIKHFATVHQMKIVFFCAPFCEHTKNLDYIKKLKMKIPELYDFSKSIKEESHFVNCFHLNATGAARFTEIFTQTVLKNQK